jgi:hypothetical protein
MFFCNTESCTLLFSGAETVVKVTVCCTLAEERRATRQWVGTSAEPATTSRYESYEAGRVPSS